MTSLHTFVQMPQSASSQASTASASVTQSSTSLTALAGLNVDELASVFRPMRPTIDEVGTTLEAVFCELVDDIALGVIFDVHRAVKKGYFLLADTDDESLKQFEIIDRPGFDIFGQLPPSRGRGPNGSVTSGSTGSSGHLNHHNLQYECPCPNCGRTLAVSRFAPHLEKCMIGLGRTSGRIASRRLADLGAFLFADRSTSSASSDTASSASRSSLGEDDFEWTMASERSSTGPSKGGRRCRATAQRKQLTAPASVPTQVPIERMAASELNGTQAATMSSDQRLGPPPPFEAYACTPPRRQSSTKRSRQTAKGNRAEQPSKIASTPTDPYSTNKLQTPVLNSGGTRVTNVFESIAAEMLTASNSSSGSSSNKGRHA